MLHSIIKVSKFVFVLFPFSQSYRASWYYRSSLFSNCRTRELL